MMTSPAVEDCSTLERHNTRGHQYCWVQCWPTENDQCRVRCRQQPLPWLDVSNTLKFISKVRWCTGTRYVPLHEAYANDNSFMTQWMITCSAVALSRALRTALVPYGNTETSTPHSSETLLWNAIRKSWTLLQNPSWTCEYSAPWRRTDDDLLPGWQ